VGHYRQHPYGPTVSWNRVVPATCKDRQAGLGNVTIFTKCRTCLPEESGSRPGPRGRVAPGPDVVIEQNGTNRDVAGALGSALAVLRDRLHGLPEEVVVREWEPSTKVVLGDIWSALSCSRTLNWSRRRQRAGDCRHGGPLGWAGTCRCPTQSSPTADRCSGVGLDHRVSEGSPR
jgi:hypothetical protein